MPSSLLTRLDMSDYLNREDALARLRRCATDAEFAAWAREYGEPLALWEAPDMTAELEEARADADAAEEDLAALKVAAETLIQTLRSAIDEMEKAL